ncbi:MAG: hypothetical protein Q4F52_01265 [Bacteroidaceae bacterium]|nr:hypothetical protein [Bacteroidaceae bacterium]
MTPGGSAVSTADFFANDFKNNPNDLENIINLRRNIKKKNDMVENFEKYYQ